MAKRREAKPVTLTPEQHRRLENLWFRYGNYGPLTTPGNHSFIQGILENGIDLRPLQTKRTPKSQIPTPECEAAVDRILNLKTDSQNILPDTHQLRLVTTNLEATPRHKPDSDLKSILDEMNRRQALRRLSSDTPGETPDAA